MEPSMSKEGYYLSYPFQVQGGAHPADSQGMCRLLELTLRAAKEVGKSKTDPTALRLEGTIKISDLISDLPECKTCARVKCLEDEPFVMVCTVSKVFLLAKP